LEGCIQIRLKQSKWLDTGTLLYGVLKGGVDGDRIHVRRIEILSNWYKLQRIASSIHYTRCSNPNTMPDAFFQSDKKRKRSKPGRAGPSSNSRPKAPRRQEKDEELESSAGEEGVDDMDFRAGRGGEDDMSDGEAIDENETAAEKRVRMAKGYLAKVRKELQDSESNSTFACPS
jgi:hypothetical protein